MIEASALIDVTFEVDGPNDVVVVAYGTGKKATSFDLHYHDYDEYWVIAQGSGTLVVGEHSYSARPGDCVPIGAGFCRDFHPVDAPVKVAYLEMSACGQ